MRLVASNGADQTSLLAAFVAGEVFCREERFEAGRAAEYHIGFPDFLFQEAIIFAVFGA